MLSFLLGQVTPAFYAQWPAGIAGQGHGIISFMLGAQDDPDERNPMSCSENGCNPSFIRRWTEFVIFNCVCWWREVVRLQWIMMSWRNSLQCCWVGTTKGWPEEPELNVSTCGWHSRDTYVC